MYILCVFNHGKTESFNCIYCARLVTVTGRHHAIVSKNEYTHDVKAGLSLRWAHMGFLFCLTFMFYFNEPRLEKNAQLVSNIVQFLSFLNLIFHGSRRLLSLYNTIFDGPGRKTPKPTGFLDAWRRL